MEYTCRGLLERTESLAIRPIKVDYLVRPGRDGGVRTTGAQMLALRRGQYQHALLILDHEGSGATEEPLELEQRLDSVLSAAWTDSAKAIVIEPELDIWMWGSDNALKQVLNWPHEMPIREWIVNHGFGLHSNGKPARPKEALEAVFPECNLPRSASNYQNIVRKISLQRCSDAAFRRLRDRLQQWFGQK